MGWHGMAWDGLAGLIDSTLHTVMEGYVENLLCGLLIIKKAAAHACP